MVARGIRAGEGGGSNGAAAIDSRIGGAGAASGSSAPEGGERGGEATECGTVAPEEAQGSAYSWGQLEVTRGGGKRVENQRSARWISCSVGSSIERGVVV